MSSETTTTAAAAAATTTTTPLVVADPTKGIKVNAGIIAKPFRDEIKAKVLALKEQGKGKQKETVSFFFLSLLFFFV